MTKRLASMLIARSPGELLAGILLLLAPSVFAQAAFPEAHERSWDFSIWAAGSTGEENTNAISEAQIMNAGIFVGKALSDEMGRNWWRGQFEYGFDFVPVFAQLTPQRIHGIGFDPVILRWNSSLRRGRVAPFIELAGGGVRTDTNLPAGNTSNFNFTVRGGAGIQIATKHAQALELSCRWWHISNANLGARNPEFNGIQVSVGWHWFK